MNTKSPTHHCCDSALGLFKTLSTSATIVDTSAIAPCPADSHAQYTVLFSSSLLIITGLMMMMMKITTTTTKNVSNDDAEEEDD